MKGPLGHLFPQGPIFSSHDIAAQCTVCTPFFVAGGWGTKEKKVALSRCAQLGHFGDTSEANLLKTLSDL